MFYGFESLDCAKVAVPKDRPSNHCLTEVCPTEVCPAKIRHTEVCSAEVRVLETCLAEVCHAEIYSGGRVEDGGFHSAVIRLAEAYVAEVCPTEVYSSEVRLMEVRSLEICIIKE